MSAQRVLETALVIAMASGVTLLYGCNSCRKKNQAPPEEEGSIFGDAGMSGPANLKHGSQGQKTVTVGKGNVEKAYQRCQEMLPVTAGDLSTPEGTLFKVFEALLMEGDDAAFETFYGLVDGTFQSRESARRYWFASARKDGMKSFLRLVFGPQDPSYMLCEKRKEGDGFRIFVGKSPPVGSNPPFTLHKVDGKWLLKTFTPH